MLNETISQTVLFPDLVDKRVVAALRPAPAARGRSLFV